MLGKSVQRRLASLCSVEFSEVVRSILGVGGGMSLKSVGNLSARESGVRSRFVDVVDAASEAARGRCFGAFSSPSFSESESSILSLSSSESSSSIASSGASKASASSFSIRRRFSCSTSTLAPKLSSSTSSHTRLLSIVAGIFRANRSLRNSGFRSSSLLRLNRSSRRILSRAFFCLTCRSCRLNLLAVLNGSEAFAEGGARFEPMLCIMCTEASEAVTLNLEKVQIAN